MADLQDFVGTWRAERGVPYSIHTFTWETAGTGLLGQWIIEATVAERPPSSALVRHWPRRVLMPVGEPRLDGRRLLFNVSGSPFVTEFRLLDSGEAVLGAAVDKLPPECTGAEHQRSIEGHTVRL